jgi:hypothetical protein
MAGNDNLSSVQGDSGSDFARSRQTPVRVKPYMGADKDSTRGRVQQWDNPLGYGGTNMSFDDNAGPSLPRPFGSE